MVAFATAEEYNLEALRDDIAKQGLYDIVKLPEGEEEFTCRHRLKRKVYLYGVRNHLFIKQLFVAV